MKRKNQTKKWTKNTFTRICGNPPETFWKILNKDFKFKKTCRCFKNGKKMKCSKYNWP